MNRTQNNHVYTCDMLWSLATAKPMLLKLRNEGKPYDPLINAIVTPSDDYSLSSKGLQQKLTISHSKLRKWIDDLYTDLMELLLQDIPAVEFQPAHVVFSIQGDEGTMSVNCRLPVIPRIGEQVDIPFIRPTIGLSPLYVYKIKHEYENDEVRTIIFVNTLSPYIASLRERALFEQKLDFRIEQELSSYELTDFLRKLYHSDTLWSTGAEDLTKVAQRKRR